MKEFLFERLENSVTLSVKVRLDLALVMLHQLEEQIMVYSLVQLKARC